MDSVAENRPKVWLIGDVQHRDFAESVALLRSTSDFHPGPPELIVLAQSRPGSIRRLEVERLRRSAPLAGVVALCGSWCEGETRTGRPLSGTLRLYWYEFPAWWRRQLSLRVDGKCPDWARADDCGLRTADCGLASGGSVLVSAPDFDSADAISVALRPAGYRTFWHRVGSGCISDASAGIWLGGQLSDTELNELAAFCLVASPVVALVDFPRRDRYEAALAAGAAAVLGKPWSNLSLLSELQRAIDSHVASQSKVAPFAA